MVIFRSVTHVREKRRNSVRVYMGWHQRWRMRQPALLSMLRSSAQWAAPPAECHQGKKLQTDFYTRTRKLPKSIRA